MMKDSITDNPDLQEKLQKLFIFIGFKIPVEYAKIAITCSAYANENQEISQDSLAIVGDHVIKLIISSTLLGKNQNAKKEFITTSLHRRESNHNLERIGKFHHVSEFLYQSNTDMDGNKKIATSIEAIFGAIFMSVGLEKAKLFAANIDLFGKKITKVLVTDR